MDHRTVRKGVDMMNATGKPDLVMKGIGGSAGGAFRHVGIEGIGRLSGHVACDTFSLQGVGSVDGEVRCAEHCELKGKMKVKGGLSAPLLVLEGQARMDGKLRGSRMRLEGMVTVTGDCEAEHFYMDGGLTVEGLLSAENMEILMQARAQVKEMGGNRIRVGLGRRRNWSRLFGWILPALEPHLYAEVIEGDDVELSETTAEMVRGNRVVIGPGCRIRHVEYGTELVVDPSAQVGSTVQR